MSVIHKFRGNPTDFGWEDVPARAYADAFTGVTRQVPLGEAEGSRNFTVRYFRLAPGTHSNLERHPHEHGVIVVHGRARLQLNDEFFDVAPFDAIFIAGDDLHQFVQQGEEPFGFLCVIEARREATAQA